MNNELFTIIERLANLLRQEARAEGLSLGLLPVQQEALYYLSTCNRYSDTTLAVSEFLGITKGTVSQTLKVLETKGLIEKEKDLVDKRITHLKVTQTGKDFLDETCPPRFFSAAVNDLENKDLQETMQSLQSLLRTYQTKAGRSAFGACHLCKFNTKRDNDIFCGLTNEPLTFDDTQLICREFSLPSNEPT